MDWLERLGLLIRSQINSLIQEPEDPEKMLEEAILNIEQESIKIRQGLAEAIATQKRTERSLYKCQQNAQGWHDKAQLALKQDNETLAREALVQWNSYHVSAQSFQNQIEQQRQIISQLRKTLQEVESNYNQAKTQKSLYLARLRSAVAIQKVQEIAGTLNTRGSLSLFEKLEAKILELESQAELMKGSTNDPLERQFAALEGNKQVEAELTRMRNTPTHPDPELEKLRSELDKI